MPRREFIKTNVETTKTNYNYSMKMAKGKDEEKARKSVHISSAGDSRCWHISAWLARTAVILAGVESVECVSPVFISVLHFCSRSLSLSVFFYLSLSVCLCSCCCFSDLISLCCGTATCQLWQPLVGLIKIDFARNSFQGFFFVVNYAITKSKWNWEKCVCFHLRKLGKVCVGTFSLA